MRIVLWILCLLAPLHADENRAKVVSFGGNCHTTYPLRDLHLRKAAYPFDWIFTTNHANFIKVLDEDFAHFLEDSYFTVSLNVATNMYYWIQFTHEFKDGTVESDWKSFKERYARRIERFRALRSYQGKVFFVRALWTHHTENAHGEFQENYTRSLELRDALDRYFPGLDYTLVIWTLNELNVPLFDQPIDRVVEIRTGRSHSSLYEGLRPLLNGYILE